MCGVGWCAVCGVRCAVCGVVWLYRSSFYFFFRVLVFSEPGRLRSRAPYPSTPAPQKHAQGIDFVEWNAGRNLDAHMRWEGFRITVRLDPSTGLLYGGSSMNCGTWMDKMGESAAHGTDGVPSSPRDGAAVEITGLLYSTLAWLTSLDGTSAPYTFPQTAVTLSDGALYPLTTWKAALLVRGVTAVVSERW